MGREQCVKGENENSSTKAITCGVPQGSILGPLFFIIYVNDLLKEFYDDNLRIILYADDTVLYTAHQNTQVAARRLEEGLSVLSKWCKCNRLTINVKKTKHMIVCPPAKKSPGLEVKLNGESLDIVHKYNYL